MKLVCVYDVVVMVDVLVVWYVVDVYCLVCCKDVGFVVLCWFDDE